MSSKYDEDQPFCDPVVRCTECNRLLVVEDLRKVGKCYHCGCRKVRNVDILSQLEMKFMVNKKIDPEFIELFEQTNFGEDMSE